MAHETYFTALNYRLHTCSTSQNHEKPAEEDGTKRSLVEVTVTVPVTARILQVPLIYCRQEQRDLKAATEELPLQR